MRKEEDYEKWTGKLQMKVLSAKEVKEARGWEGGGESWFRDGV
jgi:hypothetical protein